MGAFDELVSHITNGTAFVSSIKSYGSNISAPLIIASIAAIFMIFAAIDFIRDSPNGIGEQYIAAWNTLPALALSMIGITCWAPVLGILLTPLLSPVFKGLGSHPAMIAGALLSCDMGAYSLGLKMAGNEKSIGLYSGLILGSMMGSTLVFNIPVGLSLIPKQYHMYFAYGTLLGVLSIPFGSIVGAASMRLTPFDLSFVKCLKCLIPIFVIIFILAVLLFFFPTCTLRGFIAFSKFINAFCTVGAIIGIFQHLSEIHFPLLDTMIDPSKNDGENALMASIEAIGSIAIMMTGTLPMIYFLNKKLGKYLEKLGKYVRITDKDTTGIVAALATSIPCFSSFKEMTPRGMIINSAFCVGGAFVLGDDLAFVSAVEKNMLVPMLLAKLTSGIIGLVFAIFFADFFLNKIRQMQTFEDEEEEISQYETETETDIANAEEEELRDNPSSIHGSKFSKNYENPRNSKKEPSGLTSDINESSKNELEEV